jgi:hypothetical protein
MGGSSVSALVSTSCAEALDRFPLVAGTEVHRDHQMLGPLCSFLGLFCTFSCTRCANQKHSSHGASCRTFTLGTVLQHHPHATERIATLRFAQRRKIALKIFLGGYRLSRLFQSPDHNSSEFHLIIHSDQTNKLSKAWAVTFLILPALLPMKVTPRQTHFSLWHLLKKGSCAKLYAILWQKVEKLFVEAVFSISIHQIWSPSTSDSQLKKSFSLYLCIPESE